MEKISYLLIAAVLLFSCKEKNNKTNTAREESAVQLFYNGDILTMTNDKPTYVEVLAVEDGKIVFVGNQNEAEKKYEGAEKIDLNGKTLLPGFIDSHSHFGMVSNTMGQVDLNSPPVGRVEDIGDVLEKINPNTIFLMENGFLDGGMMKVS